MTRQITGSADGSRFEDGRALIRPADEKAPDLTQPGERRHETEQVDGDTRERPRHDQLQPRQQLGEEIPRPPFRPRADDQQQACLDEVDREQQTCQESDGCLPRPERADQSGIVSKSDGGLNVRRWTGEYPNRLTASR